MNAIHRHEHRVQATQLGCTNFMHDYGVRMAYAAGAMVKAIASVELVSRMANHGLLAFYGSAGMTLDQTSLAIDQIKAAAPDRMFGVNLIHNPEQPGTEMALVDLLLSKGVQALEASAFMHLSNAVVRYRLAGVYQDEQGRVRSRHFVMAKVSRPEVARWFMSACPEKLVSQLLADGLITTQQAKLAPKLPVASDVTVEADSAGHTDMGSLVTLLPTMLALRDELDRGQSLDTRSRIGAAGGMATPQALAAAFMMGADYVMTGSINQCSPQAGTSDVVKDLLSRAGVRDTAYGPAGDMFELGARIQVLKKGVLFPARANRLYDLWRHHERLDDIDSKTRLEIQNKFLGRSFDDVWQETRAYYERVMPSEIERASQPRARMALIFKWYFVHSMRLALAGDLDQKSNYQIHCGPSMGAFNQWVKGTALENWRQRHVEIVAQTLMDATVFYLSERRQNFQIP